jgi:nitroreductase
MEITEAIVNRRSIRTMKSDPIDDETLRKVLEAARWAPSWKNTQCWRFIVIRDNNIKSAVAGCMISGKSGENPSTNAIKQAPVLIVACAELGKSGLNAGDFATDKGDWYMYDVALAMQNLTLEAYSLGLGTVHLGLFNAQKVAKILAVPDGFCVVAMTPLGYPDESPRTVARKNLSEIVFYEKFRS